MGITHLPTRRRGDHVALKHLPRPTLEARTRVLQKLEEASVRRSLTPNEVMAEINRLTREKTRVLSPGTKPVHPLIRLCHVFDALRKDGHPVTARRLRLSHSKICVGERGVNILIAFAKMHGYLVADPATRVPNDGEALIRGPRWPLEDDAPRT